MGDSNQEKREYGLSKNGKYSEKAYEKNGHFLKGTVKKRTSAQKFNYYVIEDITCLDGLNIEEVTFLYGHNLDTYGSERRKAYIKNVDTTLCNEVVYFKYELSTNEKDRWLFKTKDKDIYSEEEFVKLKIVDLLESLSSYGDNSKIEMFKKITNMYEEISSFPKITERIQQNSKLEADKQILDKKIDELIDKKKELENSNEKLLNTQKCILEEVDRAKNRQSRMIHYLNKKDTLFKSWFGEKSELYREFTRVLDNSGGEIRFEDKVPSDFLEYLENRFSKNEEGTIGNGFYFESSTLTQFIRGLCTRQIIILCGKSGTGKTSLVRLFAEEIGGEYEIIPVQSSWMDRQDLLGTYDHINNQFYPATPLVNTLIRAEKDPNRLYLICFDEFNLSQPENYCADIFSLFETSQEPFLTLYNSQNGILGNHILEDDSKAKCNEYPQSIKIPKNVRFIGTMNVDSSVIQLSPKVIDRSVIIRVDKADNVAKRTDAERMEKRYISAQAFQVGGDDNNSVNFEDYENLAKAMEVSLSSRSKLAIAKAALCPSIFGSSSLYDDMIATKLLPMVNCIANGNLVENVTQEVSKYVKEESKSQKLLEEMKRKSKHNRILSYWSI